jgi:hypothetical protein
MKRCIAATALSLLAFPGGALAASDLRTEQHVGGGSLGVPPHLATPDRPSPADVPQYLPATGTDVAARDQQASTRSTPAAIEFVADDDSGFDWGDAGIGAATAASLLGISLAGGLTLRRRQHRVAT